jgi:hypothetical protein
MARFQIESGGREPNGAEMQAAGIASMIRAYVAARSAGLLPAHPAFDGLEAEARGGTLVEWYRTHLTCGSPG